ncbi:response regulator receiver protein [Fibrella aestuarina BUZ 2]|uniref:Response regulator receiver protein n=1 Tax=Fibrella aestuarina BUZ 2 TaxID=1166018 RepID=I0K7V3_9BACT|nr:LytTR family DNA-binding domain-containing protein [Fibrella aestuarina]CCH00206.1 response regulator receiver protein [Fibrella aestuarina BUZ 2]
MNKLVTFLRQPYPGHESTGQMLGRSGLIGAFVGLFLLVFQPFGINDWQLPFKSLKILGFGLVTFGVLLLDSLVLPRLFPRPFSEANWTVGREIAYILTHILLITVANRLYLGWLTGHSLAGGWGWVLGMTFLIGVFPAVGVVLTNYIIQLRRYTREATTLSDELETQPAHTPPAIPAPLLTLLAENGKDALTLAPDDLLAIESSDNYCTVYYLKQAQAAKELMRSSLSRLETQLDEQLPADGRPFVRCHRSYVVNLDYVDRVSGNAQGYKLHLAHGSLVVPVARKYNDTLIRRLHAG